MTIAMAVLVGVLGSVGVYLMLSRSITRIVLGVAMLGNAVNLMIVAIGGDAGTAPIVGRDGAVSDPVPQALVLTAIVIGFGVVSILLAIAYRSWTIDGNDEVEDDIHDRRLARAAPDPTMDDVDEEIEPSEFAARPDRDGPDRDGPDRDGPDRDGPDRDGPDRDGPVEDRAL